MTDGTITITKARDDFYIVALTFPNGWDQYQKCESEHDARVYAQGLAAGVCAVRDLIGNGPRFDGKISGATIVDSE